jgi:hypothetical protein
MYVIPLKIAAPPGATLTVEIVVEPSPHVKNRPLLRLFWQHACACGSGASSDQRAEHSNRSRHAQAHVFLDQRRHHSELDPVGLRDSCRPRCGKLRAGHAATWDSGRIVSSESLDIGYAGTPLKPQQRYAWKVITWDREGKVTASAPTWFETGLMSASDWKAQWITRKNPEAEKELSAIRWVWLQGADAIHVASATPAHFRYEFQLEGTPPRGACTYWLAERSLRASMAR